MATDIVNCHLNMVREEKN